MFIFHHLYLHLHAHAHSSNLQSFLFIQEVTEENITSGRKNCLHMNVYEDKESAVWDDIEADCVLKFHADAQQSIPALNSNFLPAFQ